MRFVLVSPLLVFGLAACGSDAEEPAERLSQEQIEAEVNELPLPVAGLYRRTTEVLDFDVPGASEEDLEKMKREASVENKTEETCLTEDQAAKGYKDLVQGLGEAQQGLTCGFSEFSVDGSQLDSKLACDAALGASADIAITGTLESEASDMVLDMNIGLGFVGEMKMKLSMKSERIGPCL